MLSASQMVEYRAACLTGELPPPTIVEEISSAPSSETYRLISTPQTSIPVSYTHLDVYKRQGHGSGAALPSGERH